MSVDFDTQQAYNITFLFLTEPNDSILPQNSARASDGVVFLGMVSETEAAMHINNTGCVVGILVLRLHR